MKVSWSWLNQYVNLEMAPADLAEALTMTGLEVDSAVDRFAFLESVRVGRIQAVEAHPRADRLKLCRVDIGDRVVTVVCGAPNAVAGMLAPCALPGTEMPDGKILQAGAIRGATSEAMLCSALELGLGADGSGLMALDSDLAVGHPLNRALNLCDPVFEIELTPNRSDCLSLIGVAREAAAIAGQRVKPPAVSIPAAGQAVREHTSVQILAPEHCPRYAASLIFEVTVGPSPAWLQDRLRSVGLKPINNVVDVTNFVMLELGQPLHAFDFDRLEGRRIVVRTAAEGEPFVTLDGKERRLAADTLMICDAARPVAVGGVMGGLNSEIEAGTTRVLLESACFDPVSIRKTAKRLGLATDASHRFERGVDPHGTVRALHRAAALIAEVAGGRVISGHIDEHPRPAPVRRIDLSVQAVNRRLGTDLDAGRIRHFLESLEFVVTAAGPDQFTVEVPSFRVDVARPEDLDEEIARRYGYQHIATTYPLVPAEGYRPVPAVVLRRHLKRLMAGFGFNEAITYSFVHADSATRLRLGEDDARRRQVRILNPLSEEQAVMRTSLIPGLLDTAARNIALNNRNLKLFELGSVYIASTEADRLPDESVHLAALWAGLRRPDHWDQARDGRQVACDFFDLKGVVVALLQRLGIEGASFTAPAVEACRYTRPGYTAAVFAHQRCLGRIGEVHPQTAAAYDLKQPVFIFEVEAQRLVESMPMAVTCRPIPRFPAIDRDATFIVARNLESARLVEAVQALDDPLVEQVFIFDQYEGNPVPAGRKSISLRITYRSDQATLADEQINRLHQRISGHLLKTFDADLPT